MLRLSGRLGQKCSHCISAKLGRMKSSGRKLPKRTGYLLRSNFAQFRERFAAQHVRQRGAGRDRRHASLRLKPRRRNAPAFHPNRQPHHVTAHRVCHFDRSRGIGQFARIMWVAEVLDERVLEHASEYKAERATLKSASSSDNPRCAHRPPGIAPFAVSSETVVKRASAGGRDAPQKSLPRQLNVIDTRRLTTYF